jgi:pimeloyl-ACP methyl ester carboxylesterase
MTKTLLVAVFGLSLFASSRARAAAPIYVVIGGFHSCRVGDDGSRSAFSGKLWRAFSSYVLTPMTQNLGVNPAVVAGCFTEELSLSPRLDFQLSTNSAPESEANAVTGLFTEPTPETMRPVVDVVLAQVESSLKQSPASLVYFVGHSYGAWVAMHAALEMLARGQNVQTLFTIDPISPLNCNPLRFLEALVETVPGCQEAPADIVSNDRIRLRDELKGGWRNFYETQFHRLHSGPIPELDDQRQSFRVRVDSPNPIYNDQHATIAEDPKIWDFIAKAALRDAQITRN